MTKSTLTLLVFCVLGSIGSSAPNSEASTKDAMVRVPLENYLKGHATGDGEYMRKAFHANARIMGIRESKLTVWTVEEYVRLFPGKADPEEPKRKRRIKSVEVTGDAAIAKLVFDYPQSAITDYMLLLRIDGEWKIVDKIYQGQRRARK